MCSFEYLTDRPMRTDEISPQLVKLHSVRVLMPRVWAASRLESSFKSVGAAVVIVAVAM